MVIAFAQAADDFGVLCREFKDGSVPLSVSATITKTQSSESDCACPRPTGSHRGSILGSVDT